MSPADGSMTPQRIALVEDDTRTRQVMVTLLEEEGWVVEAFDRAENALPRLLAGEFGALITDHILPGMKGLDLVVAVRSAVPQTRCVVISGTTPLDAAVTRNVRWITKPINFDTLVDELSGRVPAVNPRSL